MNDLPEGTVTFLFTDVEGSTRLWERHPQTMPAVLARHDEVISAAVGDHGGHVVKSTGDGFLAVFGTAPAGLAAAVAAQLALAAEPWGPPGPLAVRMGLHSGVAHQRAGDYFGGTLNRAARLMAVAHGGQVVCSQTTADLAQDDLDGELSLVDLGECRLRDLGRSERVFQVVHPGLGRDFPPLRSLDAFRSNLPLQVTSFIGRDRDLTEVARALEAARLVTLIGVGGVGKTRLALQVAADVLPRFADGVWLCELAAASEPEAAYQIVAAGLGVEQRPGVSLPVSISDFLRTKRMLVVLDNCEHLVDVVGRLAAEVLRECPETHILATSREALAVAGEQVWPLRSLGVPDDGGDADAVEASDAVRLFVDRARSVRPGFEVDRHSAAAVVEICRRLDGVPLAIELAAARTSAMSAPEIAGLLDERFRLLTGGRRTAVERHQALRATVDWSYSLLDGRDRSVFDRLAVFSGSFDVEAASAVVTGDGIEAWDVVDALTSLVAKSMLVPEETADGRTRYTMLETLRQYGRERLDQTGDADGWRRRHAGHFARFTERIAPGAHGPDEVAVTAEIIANLDNLRAAVAWSLDSDEPGDVGVALGIIAFLALQGNNNRTLGTGAWAVDASGRVDEGPPGIRCAVLGAAAFEVGMRGDVDEALRLATAALSGGIPPDCPEPALAPLALTLAFSYQGRVDAALVTMTDFIDQFHAAGDAWSAAVGQAVAACWAVADGRPDTGAALAEQVLSFARARGNPSLLSAATFALGWSVLGDDPGRAVELFDESLGCSASVAGHSSRRACVVLAAQAGLRLGRLGDAVERLQVGIAQNRDAGDRPSLLGSLDVASEVVFELGQPEAAAVLVGFVDGPAGAANLMRFSIRPHDDLRAQVSAALGPDRFAELAAQGEAMAVDDVTAAALGILASIAAELSTDGP